MPREGGLFRPRSLLYAAIFPRSLMDKLSHNLAICSLALILSSLLPGQASGEGVTNVRCELERDQVVILYDLVGRGHYTVTAHMSEDAGRSYPFQLKSVSGDIGESIEPGRGKKIVWDCLRDVENLIGRHIVFEVRATRLRQRRTWPWLLGAGAAGAAGWGAREWLGRRDGKGKIQIDIEDPHAASADMPGETGP